MPTRFRIVAHKLALPRAFSSLVTVVMREPGEIPSELKSLLEFAKAHLGASGWSPGKHVAWPRDVSPRRRFPLCAKQSLAEALHWEAIVSSTLRSRLRSEVLRRPFTSASSSPSRSRPNGNAPSCP